MNSTHYKYSGIKTVLNDDTKFAESKGETESLKKYRQALNRPDLTDNEIKQFRNHFRNMAEILIEHYLEIKKAKKNI